MSISSEITRIQNKRDQSFTEVANKGVTVPAGSTIDDLPGLIAQIEQGSGSGSGGIIYQDLDGYLNLSEDEANVISIVDTLDTAGGTVRTITGAVESGGEYTANDWLDLTKPIGAIVSSITFSAVNVNQYMLERHTGITSVTLLEATKVPYGFVSRCSNLSEFKAPKVTELGGEALREIAATAIALPSWVTNGSSTFYGCPNLTTVDRGGAGTIVGTYTFRNCSVLSTLILRSTTMVELGGTAAFNGTPFASGGSGGTIYIPKSLYDHLGDGTSLDYKAATNWSTLDGYGTVTWAQIEGSQYENYYADGTPIT